MKKLLLFLAALLTAMTAWASTFTVTNNGNTFTITRSSSSGAENVYYRTVSLSAMAGVHFTEAVGILYFLEGESEKTVTVTETPIGSIAEQYLFQMETMRTYRLEVLDYSGSQLAYKDRDITYGSDYQHSADYVNQSITDLVYFDYNGNIKSDNDNRYLDVAYSSSDWIKVTDAGYPQGVHTISTDNLYHGSSALRTYLNNQGNRMYATVYFNQKEEADGYQYIQILADNSTTYDGNDQWGEVSDPSISLYKACFEMSYTGDYSTDEHYQFFPHRDDYVNRSAEINAGLNRFAFDYDNSYLYQQKYQSSDYDAPDNGALNLATTVKNLNIRFDAGGNSTDDWDFKNLKVRLALVDNTAPTVIDNYQVSGGLHFKGNTIYVSVPFSEIVTVSGTPTLSTTWGTLSYVGGTGSNVLTFVGTIGDNASGTFTVSGYSGTISDLAGNPFCGSISHSFDIGVSGRYTITYDLAGGSLPEGKSNPETYSELTATFTLNNPTLPGYTFVGWTGSNGDTPQTVVTIEQGSYGDRSYTANWERLERYYTYDSETGELALIWGEFNKDNKWGSDVTASAVKSVTATSEVSFTGYCKSLFSDFNQCVSMDLSRVNTSEMTRSDYMFSYCKGLTSLNLSGWNTANVTDMSFMFVGCSVLTTLNLSGWNTANVTNMSYMFTNCKGLTTLDLSSFNIADFTNISWMFAGSSNLTIICVSEDWSTKNIYNSGGLFTECYSLVGGMGTTFDGNYTDKTYARIDGGPDNPGYFTAKSTTLSGDEYIIYTATDWDIFCDMLAGGESFIGKTVKLGADISVSRMAGKTGSSVSTPFAGTFDGCGKTLTFNYTGNEDFVAPFAWSSSSPIFRNLTISGTINTTGYYAGGLIGRLYGTVTVEHCTSNVDMTIIGNSGGFVGMCEQGVNFNDCMSSTVIHSAGAQNSGFVGLTRNSGYPMNFTGCVFNGKLLKIGNSGSLNGGFIGGTSGGKTVITDCLVNTAALASGEIMATDGSGTFVRLWDTTYCRAFNSYYITALGTPQGKHARSITADENVTVANAGTPETVYYVSGITAYPTGIKYNDVLYAANSDEVSLTLGHSDLHGYTFNGYEASAGTLSGSDNPYTLTMPDEDVTLTALYMPFTTICGDVTGDKVVNIADVTALIDYLLSSDASSINLDAADCNGDSSVTIGDVTALIDYLLNGSWN